MREYAKKTMIFSRITAVRNKLQSAKGWNLWDGRFGALWMHLGKSQKKRDTPKTGVSRRGE
jgi:hypothetical protein